MPFLKPDKRNHTECPLRVCLPPLTPDSLTPLRGASPGLSCRLGDRRPWESSFLSQDFSSCFSFRPQPGRGLCQQVTLETQGPEPWPCPGPTRGCPSLSLPPAPHCGSSLQPSPRSSGPACDPGPPGHTSNLNPQGGAPRPAASAPPGSSEKQFTPDSLSGKNPLFLSFGLILPALLTTDVWVSAHSD